MTQPGETTGESTQTGTEHSITSSATTSTSGSETGTGSETGEQKNCAKAADAQACMAMGCTLWSLAGEISIEDDLCTCEASAFCLDFEQGIAGGGPSPAVFARMEADGSNTVAMFLTRYAPPPIGWVLCAEHPSPPPECACYGDGMQWCPEGELVQR